MLNALKYETYEDYCKSLKGVGEYILPKSLWDKLKLEEQGKEPRKD